MGTNLSRVVMLSVIAVALLAAGCGSDPVAEDGPVEAEAAGAGAADGPLPMIVDYSPTLSDVPALMFLATHPGVDLVAVTLPGTGESDCEPGVRNTRALLVIAGHAEVPVACGSEAPMAGDRDWPLNFREASRTLHGVVLPSVSQGDPIDAVDLLTSALEDADQPITIVALGPLTNLGRVLDGEPELRTKVRSIVTMGGAFDVPGNVPDAPDAEWNLYIDPASVRAVLGSGVPVTFVPLDATNFVPGGIRILARLTASVATESGEAVRQLWAASLGTERSITAEWWYFWDELAAVIAVDPSVATISERVVAIEDTGATVEHDDGVPALVASAADPARFEQRFLETFAGGDVPDLELTGSEEQYLETMRDALVRLSTALDQLFSLVEEQADQVPADELTAEFLGGVFDEMRAFHDDMSGVESPDTMRAQHQALLDATAGFLDREDTGLGAVRAAAPPEPVGVDGFFEFFFGAAEDAGLVAPFDAFDAACGDLELTAYGLGATEGLCSQ